MTREREQCVECGFDSDLYDRADTITSQSIMPAILGAAIEGLDDASLGIRPAPDTWSIGEYLDHVRETTFSNRFAIEVARQQPGTDLGDAPEPAFTSEAKDIDVAVTLDAVRNEFDLMQQLLGSLNDDEWDNVVTVDGKATPIGWFARHVLHDAFHHLVDIGRIRYGLGHGAPDGQGVLTHINVSTGGVPKASIPEATIDGTGISGDSQNDRRHHGRPLQAVCLWSGDVIADLAGDGHPIGAGNAGENLTVEGIEWSSLRPGSQLLVGSVQLVVSAHAIPCAKNAQWFSDGDFKRIGHEASPGRSRLYAVPLNTGEIRSGDVVQVEQG